MLPEDQRHLKGLVARLSVAIFENTAAVVRLLLRLRERLAIGAIDSAEAELVADGASKDALHDPNNIVKNAAAMCLHLLPSCVAAVKSFDRDRPDKRQRWALAPSIPLATVVAMIEEDVFIPLLTQLQTQAENKGKNKRKLTRRLLYPNKEAHPLFKLLAQAGAYRCLVLAGQACAAAGRDCANAQLKEISHIDAPDNYTPYMSALRKWGPGDQHQTEAWGGLSLAERIELMMSRPFDVTWTLPAMQLATDVLAARASRKHKHAAADRHSFVRGKTREGHLGQWELPDMIRHIRKVKPGKKTGKCKGRDCDCDVRSVPGPLTVDKVRIW